MQFSLRASLTLICAALLGASLAAQTPAHKSLPTKRYCHPEGGFCFLYPATWSVRGEVFAGNGVVIAPEQKQERALWDEITAGLVVPAPKADADPVTIDQLIEQTMASLRDQGQNVQTVQRQVRTVDGTPAQLLTLHYQEKGNGHDWIEKLALIEGGDGEIYSVALKCSPQSLSRLESVLSSVLHSWKLPEDAAPPVTVPDDKESANGTKAVSPDAPTTPPPSDQEPPKN
jgi:hypothetical protein